MPQLKESTSSFKPVPAGAHAARCYGMVSIGTQIPTNPTYQPSFQVVLMFEIPAETIERDGKQVPLSICRFLGTSLGKPTKPTKTNQLLSSWRGKPFTIDEAKGFDLAKVVGHPCLLNIIHEDKNGQTRESIASISPLPKGMAIPPQINKSIIYEIEHGQNDVFKALPEWLQNKIKACAEWQTPAEPPVAAPSIPAGQDDVPF